jgi:sRNA-binding carbon storage regulator CsrA
VALVIVRRAGEPVVLVTPDGQRVTSTPQLTLAPDEARLKIDAAREILVLRKELEDRARSAPVRPPKGYRPTHTEPSR